MATSLKVSDLTAVTALAAGDLLNVVDVSDVTYSATGTNKKITTENFFSGVPVPASFNDTLTLSKGSQDYLFTDRATTLCVQSQTSGQISEIGQYSKDGDATDTVFRDWFGRGTPDAVGNRERLRVGWQVTSSAYEIYTEADGTGTLRPIVLYTEGNANQLYLATGGQNIMGYNAAIAVSGESAGNTTPIFQVHNNGAGLASFTSWESTVTRPATVVLGRSKGGAIGTLTALSDNDPIGEFSFVGVDVTTTGDMKTIGASIQAVVNGTPAANRMPTDLEFYTAEGASDDDIALGMKLEKDGTLNVGTHSAIGAETVTGYITIKDIGGTERKIAVVS